MIRVFNAFDRDISNVSSAVRGVRLGSVTEGDEPKEAGVAPQETGKIESAYATLLDDKSRKKALELLQKKPELAVGLAGLLADHYKTLAQP